MGGVPGSGGRVGGIDGPALRVGTAIVGLDLDGVVRG
jgi:hypothetical protein